MELSATSLSKPLISQLFSCHRPHAATTTTTKAGTLVLGAKQRRQWRNQHGATALSCPHFHPKISNSITKWRPRGLDPSKANVCRAAGVADYCEDSSRIPDENTGKVGDKVELKARTLEEKWSPITHIRWMLRTFGDGRINISAYDTAWVGMIKNKDGSDNPQFPSAIEWIAQNQLSDGSWGDQHQYLIYDRLLSTLACVVALRSWNMHPHKCEQGIGFLDKVSREMERPNRDSLTNGFEMIFPPLLERAQTLGIQIPFNAPFLVHISALRAEKLARIPRNYMHEVATAMLYSLEGIDGLNWEKLLKLQSEDGDFLTSPSSTAFAFIQTGDHKCFQYLNNVVRQFNGGAPMAYPIDLFARLWAVDRLHRLGISHIFQEEIMECLDYVHRYWTSNGIWVARNARVCDVDDTCMAFRLLRLQGYNVYSDVFKQFKSEDEGFYCLGGEQTGSPSTILNLYRASQVAFPGENILEDANNFSYRFLKESLSSNQGILDDRWVICKDLAGELKFGLEIPWYACLPRIEARFYIEQYGGADDVWIAKTLYRLPEVSNNHYLEVAKSDFNECQIQHQLEWTNMQKWWKELKLEEYGLTREKLLLTFFLAAATIFEPERSIERRAWAKLWVIIQTLGIYLDRVATSRDKRNAFLESFKGDASLHNLDEMGKSLHWIIQEFIFQLSIDTFKRLRKDIRQQLASKWETWLIEAIDVQNGSFFPHEGAFLAHIINLCSFGEERLSDEEYKRLSHLTNKVCHQLLQYEKNEGTKNGKEDRNMSRINSMEIERSMQQLLQLIVVQTKSSSESDIVIHPNEKQTFLNVAKAFYYTAYCDKETINFHISKVIFEPLL